MPAPLIATGGLRKLQRDLRAMVPDAAVEVRQVVKQSLEPMVQVARRQGHARRQTGELGDRWRASMRGASGALTNTLPQARVHEFGGTIAPKGTPITITAAEMVYGQDGAIAQEKDNVERDLVDGLDRLASRHGWR